MSVITTLVSKTIQRMHQHKTVICWNNCYLVCQWINISWPLTLTKRLEEPVTVAMKNLYYTWSSMTAFLTGKWMITIYSGVSYSKLPGLNNKKRFRQSFVSFEIFLSIRLTSMNRKKSLFTPDCHTITMHWMHIVMMHINYHKSTHIFVYIFSPLSSQCMSILHGHISNRATHKWLSWKHNATSWLEGITIILTSHVHVISNLYNKSNFSYIPSITASCRKNYTNLQSIIARNHQWCHSHRWKTLAMLLCLIHCCFIIK